MSSEENKAKEETPIPVETTKETKNGDDKKKTEELSEEDMALKEGLELAVERLEENDDGLHKPALDHLVNEIKSSTSSMTSVPKPLKFLRPHYNKLKAVYESWPSTHSMKKSMADVMSVLAMTMQPPGSRECLKFKLAGTSVNISSWGHEYVRSLAGEVAEEYNQRVIDADATDDDAVVDDLFLLVDDMLPFQMKHNAEADAVDLLLEVRQLRKLIDTPVVDERNFERVCLYLLRSADYIVDPEDVVTLFDITYTIYKRQKRFTDALRVAIKMGSDNSVLELFSEEAGASALVQQQMAMILARHRSHIVLPDHVPATYNEIIGNCSLSDQYLAVAREMDVMAPKAPEDIYKTAGPEGASTRGRGNAAANSLAVDSARGNLASSFVNAFVNAGYNKDKLMGTDTSSTSTANAAADNSTNWIYKNKGHGMMSAAASLGMIMMWNVDEGLNAIDKYFHMNEEFAKAGACLGIGILCNGIRNESDPALALLSEYLEDSSTKPTTTVRTAAISGLGLAYAGTQREDIKELLEAIVGNTETTSITEVALAGLSLGLLFVGTCNDDISSLLLQRLMETSEVDLNHTMSRFLSLGLGLLYLGAGERCDAILEAIRIIEHPRGKYTEYTVETCAYAHSGNVLKVQQMLRTCTDHLTENAEHQAVAVLGIALIAFGEEIGTEMTLRTFDHLLQYGELPVRRVVPLAIALLYISNPEYAIIDQFSRLSHDADAEVSQCAIFGLGLVSAGSNNSRVANLLRQLADFYAKEANHLFMVRIAQGLNAMGKGLLGLTPFHSDR